jgi:hypothetical protein
MTYAWYYCEAQRWVKSPDLPGDPGYAVASAKLELFVSSYPPLPQTLFFGKRGVLNLKKLEKERVLRESEESLRE